MHNIYYLNILLSLLIKCFCSVNNIFVIPQYTYSSLTVYRLSFIVYRLSFIVYRLSFIVYRLSFIVYRLSVYRFIFIGLFLSVYFYRFIFIGLFLSVYFYEN